jgi:hypothetical protein
MKHCIVAALLFGGVVLASNATANDKDEKIAVKTLKFTPKDSGAVQKIGGKGKATVLTDASAVENLVGKDNAKSLTDMVNFEKEELVLISWTQIGTPSGKLMYEVKGTGKDRKVIFYVQAPDAKIRSRLARVAADFFVLPKDVAVDFEPKERK